MKDDFWPFRRQEEAHLTNAGCSSPGGFDCKATATSTTIAAVVRESLGETLNKAARIVAQSGQRKAVDGQPKLHAWHASEVDCISKGKARQPCEFGVNVGIASTLRGNLIVGAKTFHGNPYDGHILYGQLEQAAILMQDSAAKPATAFVDLGYRGTKLLRRRQEGGDLLVMALFAPVRDGGCVPELARRAGNFAHARAHPTSPAP